VDIEAQIEGLKGQKAEVIRSQQYEKAAELRDNERKLQEQLEAAKTKWEDDSKNNRVIVTEEDVAEVVSMMCGIPVTKVSESEMGK